MIQNTPSLPITLGSRRQPPDCAPPGFWEASVFWWPIAQSTQIAPGISSELWREKGECDAITNTSSNQSVPYLLSVVVVFVCAWVRVAGAVPCLGLRIMGPLPLPPALPGAVNPAGDRSVCRVSGDTRLQALVVRRLACHRGYGI
jgi:hypothetical protein